MKKEADTKKSNAESKSQNHDNISCRGRVFEGVVVSDAAPKTVTVSMETTQKVKKYNRYMKKTAKLHAHNPENINAKVGDHVRISECRKLSKTKNFIVVNKW